MSDASLLLIAGPPGAGKTTVAKRVVSTWGAPVAYLEGDVFWSFFVTRAPATDPGDALKRDARILVQALIASAARFARGGYDAVVDFSIGPWAMDSIRAGLKDIPVDYVVLCPSEVTCARRCAMRSDGAIHDYAPFRPLHDAFTRLAELEAHALRDDTAEPDELAARIHTGLANGTYRLPSYQRG